MNSHNHKCYNGLLAFRNFSTTEKPRHKCKMITLQRLIKQLLFLETGVQRENNIYRNLNFPRDYLSSIYPDLSDQFGYTLHVKNLQQTVKSVINFSVQFLHISK